MRRAILTSVHLLVIAFLPTGPTAFVQADEARVAGTGDTVVGTVTDADTGRPVERFNVVLREGYGRVSRDPPLDASWGREGEDFAGADGSFRLEGLPRGARLTLVVTADGYPRQYFDDVIVTREGAGEPLAIELSKRPANHRALAGRVVDADGKPLARVELRAVAYAPGGNPADRPFYWSQLLSGQLARQGRIRTIAEARTDAAGAFSIPDVPSTEVDLAYWGKGVPRTRLQDAGALPAGQRRQMELRVPRPAAVKGRINLDAYDVVTHLLLVERNDRTSSRVTVEDGQDRYVIPDLAAGAYGLYVGGAPVRMEDGASYRPHLDRVEFEVAEGETRELDLGHGPAHAVHGRVTALEAPVAGAYVALVFADDKARRIARADGDGRFRFAHVPPGKYVLLVTGDKPIDIMTTSKSAGATPVEVTDADVEHDVEVSDRGGL
jgi:hypothetical protein